MTKKAGLYVFLRSKITAPITGDIPAQATRLLELATKEGYKTKHNLVAQFLYHERRKHLEEKVEQKLAAPVIEQQPSPGSRNLEDAIRSLDAIMNLLMGMKRSLMLEVKFRSHVQDTILPALKKAGIL